MSYVTVSVVNIDGSVEWTVRHKISGRGSRQLIKITDWEDTSACILIKQKGHMKEGHYQRRTVHNSAFGLKICVCPVKRLNMTKRLTCVKMCDNKTVTLLLLSLDIFMVCCEKV